MHFFWLNLIVFSLDKETEVPHFFKTNPIVGTICVNYKKIEIESAFVNLMPFYFFQKQVKIEKCLFRVQTAIYKNNQQTIITGEVNFLLSVVVIKINIS